MFKLYNLNVVLSLNAPRKYSQIAQQLRHCLGHVHPILRRAWFDSQLCSHFSCQCTLHTPYKAIGNNAGKMSPATYMRDSDCIPGF